MFASTALVSCGASAYQIPPSSDPTMLAEPPITIATTSECPKLIVSGEVYLMTSM
jgi:hypothetical protein